MNSADCFAEFFSNMEQNMDIDKTLVLRVQMKGIVKPPMWREVEVPANCSFTDLHEVIQELVGLSNGHLWQFNRKAYCNDLCIAERQCDPFMSAQDNSEFTDEASVTPLIEYLANKGDTLEYVYDFGDGWIFTVKVLNVLDRKCEQPVCVKFKSEFNAFEDLGGPYVYDVLRAYADSKSDMTPARRKQVEDEFGGWFDSINEFKDWIARNKIDIEDLNKFFASRF